MKTKKINTYYIWQITATILISSMLFACKKSNVEDTIPSVPVNFTIYLTLPQYSQLNSPGGVVLTTGGYKGIVVYRKSITEFMAFDRACSYDPTVSGAILTIDSSGVTMVDLHCGSKFLLQDGSVLHGPATRPMKQYHSDYVASENSVYIYN